MTDTTILIGIATDDNLIVVTDRGSGARLYEGYDAEAARVAVETGLITDTCLDGGSGSIASVDSCVVCPGDMLEPG